LLDVFPSHQLSTIIPKQKSQSRVGRCFGPARNAKYAPAAAASIAAEMIAVCIVLIPSTPLRITHSWRFAFSAPLATKRYRLQILPQAKKLVVPLVKR
jgi:hypothetical protein